MIRQEIVDTITVITIDRPDIRNGVNRQTARMLTNAFLAFEADVNSPVAVLTGAGGTFCAGADLKAIADGTANRLEPNGDAPMGPSRMVLSKPVIAAIEGYAVAGGLELACLCDMRVAASDATLGVFCRVIGVPLIDGGAVRLPRIIGLGRAMDLILTGRPVYADEALMMGLVNRISEPGEALSMAIQIAREIASFPSACMKVDRASAYRSFDLSFEDAMRAEFAAGMDVMDEAYLGASRFRDRSRGAAPADE